MNIFVDPRDSSVLGCDMEDGTRKFGLGWVQHNELGWYCLCYWMAHVEDLDVRPWLSPTAYPEEHFFPTMEAALQALRECGTAAVIGGFRGRAPHG
jgi:hypothetical protein